MRRHSTLLIPLLSASVLSLTALAGEIRGRVVLDEKPVARARVSAVPYETPVAEARREARAEPPPSPLGTVETGSDGSFALTVPADPAHPDRPFRIEIARPGIVAVLVLGGFDSSENEDLGELTVWKSERLGGRVLGPDGAPVKGAEVVLTPGRGNARFDSGDPTTRVCATRTAADGSFAFTDASSDNDLTVHAAGLASQALNAKAGMLAKPVRLSPGTSIPGTVRRPDRKQPAPGTLVRFEGRGVRTRWFEAGPSGAFRLEGVPPGRGVLVAEAGDEGSAQLAWPPAGDAPVTITLSLPATLEGRVVDVTSGRPVARAKITTKNGGSPRLVRSGPDGRYRVTGLLPQRLTLRADEPRYVPYERSITISVPGENRRADLPLTLGATLSGRVADELGQAVSGAKGRLAPGSFGTAELSRYLTPWGPTSFVTAADGSFRATRLAPGENQRLTVVHPDHAEGGLSGLDLAPGGSRSGVTVTLRKGLRLAGTVRGADGVPLAGVQVVWLRSRQLLFRGGGSMSNSTPGTHPVTTGADGRYEFRGLAPGEYSLMALRKGSIGGRLGPFQLADGEPPPPADLVLAPAASISGTVRNRDGGPAGRLWVATIQPPDPSASLFPVRTLTRPDGSFLLEGLSPGRAYDLLAGPDPRPGRASSGSSGKGIVTPAEGVELVVPTPGRIAGTVVDAQGGLPVTDFVVWCEDSQSRGNPLDRQPVHSEEGLFVVDDVPPGTWTLNVEAKGYQQARLTGITVSEATTSGGVEVKIARGAALKGKVVEARSGRGVPDARVAVGSEEGRPYPARFLFSGAIASSGIVTDADGLFETDRLAPGRYTVAVHHADFTDATEVVEVKEPGASVKVSLTGGGHVGGTVVGETRQPAAGADVQISVAGEGSGSVALQLASTDEAGRFVFNHLAPGRYSLAASLRGSAAPPVATSLQAGESRDDLILTLEPGTTLHGMVSGLSDAERADLWIWASGADRYDAHTRTRGDGTFELSGVPSGTLSVRAAVGGSGQAKRTVAKRIEVAPDERDATIEIVFEPAGSALSGTVTRGGQPVSGGTVSAMARDQSKGQASGSSRIDDDGRYRIESLADGTYVVSVNNYASSSSSSLPPKETKVAGETTLDFQLPDARLAGTVRDASTQQPLKDASLTASSADPASRNRSFGHATSDSAGRFFMEGVEPGSYKLQARKTGFISDEKLATAAADGPSEVTVEMSRADGIGLQVRDGVHGSPIQTAIVRVKKEPGETVLIDQVVLDSQGRGETSSLRPGSYSLAIYAPGYAPAFLSSVPVPSPTVAVSVTPGGTLEIHAGREILATKAPQARLQTASGAPYPYTAYDAEGRIWVSLPMTRIENLAPGQYTLAVGRGASRTITIVEGGVTVVELP